MAIDPVCKMQVNEEGASHRKDHKGKTYYFCSKQCAVQFEENPERYLTPGQAPPAGAKE